MVDLIATFIYVVIGYCIGRTLFRLRAKNQQPSTIKLGGLHGQF